VAGESAQRGGASSVDGSGQRCGGRAAQERRSRRRVQGAGSDAAQPYRGARRRGVRARATRELRLRQTGSRRPERCGLVKKLHAGGGAAHSTTPALATGAILDSAARVDHLGALRKANPAFVSAAAVAEAERDAATLAALAEARPVPMRKSDGPSAMTPPTAE